MLSLFLSVNKDKHGEARPGRARRGIISCSSIQRRRLGEARRGEAGQGKARQGIISHSSI